MADETGETVEQKLARWAYVIEAQSKEIDRLRAQVTALTEGTGDAHSTLRRLYLDEAQSPNTRVRAAQAALNVEKARLAPQQAPLELVGEEIEDLAAVVQRQRARADKMMLEPPYRVLPGPSRHNGNGDDSDD